MGCCQIDNKFKNSKSSVKKKKIKFSTKIYPIVNNSTPKSKVIYKYNVFLYKYN